MLSGCVAVWLHFTLAALPLGCTGLHSTSADLARPLPECVGECKGMNGRWGIAHEPQNMGLPIITEEFEGFGGDCPRSTIPPKGANPIAFPPKTYFFDENTIIHLSIRYRASRDGGYCDPSEISASSEIPEISDSSMRAYQQASIQHASIQITAFSKLACQHSDYSIQHTDYSIQQASIQIPAYSIQITAYSKLACQHTAYRLQHTDCSMLSGYVEKFGFDYSYYCKTPSRE